MENDSIDGQISEYGTIGKDVFVVERVLGKQMFVCWIAFYKNFFTLFFLLRIGEAVQYKIKWQGYDRPEDVTWEDKKSCHCPDLIAQFEDDNRMNAKKITQIPGGTRIELIEASNDISESTSTIIVSSLCAELTKVI